MIGEENQTGTTEAEATEQPSDPFDAAIADWEAASTPAEQEQPAPEEADQPTAEQQDGGDNNELAVLRNWALEVETERLVNLNAQETAQVFDEAREAIADFKNVSPDYHRLWLNNEYDTNPEMQNTWESRHESQEAWNAAMRVKDRAIKQLITAAKREHERIAGVSVTQDRELVGFAVKNASSHTQPERKAPDYGRMSDGEFANSIQDDYGFSPF